MVINNLNKLNRGIKRISKRETCERILHCSLSTFDNYIKLGLIPPGHKEYDIELKNKIMHDYVFAATMCKADYLGSSIEDEQHLIKYVKDTVDDVDASDETTFRRWVATMVGNGIPIDWYEIC